MKKEKSFIVRPKGEVGKKIFAHVKAEGISIVEFGNRCGIGVATAYRWVKGDYDLLRPKQVEKLHRGGLKNIEKRVYGRRNRTIDLSKKVSFLDWMREGYLSVADFAELLGVTEATVVNWRQEYSTPRLRYKIKINEMSNWRILWKGDKR